MWKAFKIWILVSTLTGALANDDFIPRYPTEPRGVSPQAVQIVNNITNNAYGYDCECGGLTPCPAERQPVQCDYAEGAFNTSHSVAPNISRSSEVFAQIFIPTVDIGVYEFSLVITTCPAGQVLDIFLVIDDTFLLWPADDPSRFTWTTRPTTTNFDFFFISSYTCAAEPLPITLRVRKNFGPILDLIRNTGQSTTTIALRNRDTGSISVVLPFGYNASVSADLPGAYGDSRFVSNFSATVTPYALRSFALTQPGNDEYPIGFPDGSVSFVPFANLNTLVSFNRQLAKVPNEIDPLATLPGPLVEAVFVLNLDAVPSDPAFYNGTALAEFFAGDGNYPFYAPYGVCVSNSADMSDPFCTPTPYDAYPANLTGVTEFTGVFSLRTDDGDSIGNLSVAYFDEPVANVSGTLFHSAAGLTVATTAFVGEAARFFMQVFPLNISGSPDAVGDTVSLRVSNVVRVNVSSYIVNTGPVATQPVVETTVLSGEAVSGFVPLLNTAEGVVGIEFEREPELGLVTFNTTTHEWTYYSYLYFNSVDDNGNRSDYFVFRVIDSSNSPCDEPLPQYTTNLKNPVAPCMGCGNCASNMVNVSVYVIPVYYAPVLSNSSFSLPQASTAPVIIVIDSNDYYLPMPGDYITTVNMPVSTANGVIDYVPSLCCFIYTYSLTNPFFVGTEIISYTVESNRQLLSNVGNITIVVTV